MPYKKQFVVLYLRQSCLPYLPLYNAHFLSMKITIKIAVRIIHGF